MHSINGFFFCVLQVVAERVHYSRHEGQWF